MFLSDLYQGQEYSHEHNLPSYLTITYYEGVFSSMCKLQPFICEKREEGFSSLLSAGDAINLNKIILNLQM